MAEVRVKDSKTGGEKGMKDERFELIPWGAMEEVARVYGYGANKYSAQNWRRGFAWSLSLGALFRHIALYACGYSRDRESGLHHLAHAVFHCLALITFEREGLGTDDRVLEKWKEGPEYVGEQEGVLRSLWARTAGVGCAAVGDKDICCDSGAEPRDGISRLTRERDKAQ